MSSLWSDTSLEAIQRVAEGLFQLLRNSAAPARQLFTLRT